MIDRINKFLSTTFHVIAITLTILILIPAGVIIYWMGDKTFPVENVEIEFGGWSPTDPHVALIRWKADRNRICMGRAYRWMHAGHQRNLLPIELPPPGAATMVGGKGVVWTEEVYIPGDVTNPPYEKIDVFVRMAWVCNPLQQWWPLVFDPPPVTIHVPPQRTNPAQ